MTLLSHYFTLFLLVFVLTCSAQDFIQITSPTNGQTVSSKSQLTISYNVIGVPIVSPPPANATYPSGMTAEFQWLQKGTTNNPLSLNASNSLVTKPYVAGIQNKAYTSVWNIPNCHFFSRYTPSNYNFQMVFTPTYNIPSDQNQQSIVVPLTIQVNNATFPKC
ncbi:uncharacterized protein BX664DRAFT_340315 [Halteromyces radiatus]|uniref:uncharacterized protein n=1 Tax=Halteromyces radiatus TaxID=101107 RepID=UPI00222057C8|nr:uncharacterized protein BX664DRAFT_340315 [Halteromyces radiatus]KAI8081399.1 hypothetical protein BX664DRAFT_340315 [Halteromyces radiatus]